MEGKPYKAILLELVLAGCGAVLTDRALRGLAVLAKKHEIRFIVDEVMTGGRTSALSPLLVLHRCPAFLDCVAFATMGKWMGCGLVLRYKDSKKIDESFFFSSRGPSTTVSCSHARVLWNVVVGRISKINQRREEVIKAKKANSTECWGEGLLLFGPFRRNDSVGALKNRFLPMLEPGLEPDRFPLTKHQEGWDKVSMDKLIQERIILWKDFHWKPSSTQEQVDLHFCDWVLHHPTKLVGSPILTGARGGDTVCRSATGCPP